ITGAWRDVFRNLFGPVKKLGARQNQSQRILDSRFEITRLPRLPVKGKRGHEILLRYRPAKRAPGGVRYDLSRAGQFFIRVGGTARKNPAAAGCFVDTGRTERADDFHTPDSRTPAD